MTPRISRQQAVDEFASAFAAWRHEAARTYAEHGGGAAAARPNGSEEEITEAAQAYERMVQAGRARKRAASAA